MAALKRWFMYVFAPWLVETSLFWFFMGPLAWFEYWYTMEWGLVWGNSSEPQSFISEQLSIEGVRCPVGHVADSDSNMDTWELMRFRIRERV